MGRPPSALVTLLKRPSLWRCAYSYMTAMDEMGKILARGRVANDREAVGQFLHGACRDGQTAAVLEATRN